MTAKAIYAEEKNQEPKSYVQEAKDILEKILREQKAQSTETEKSESSKPKFEFKPFGSKS